MTVESAFDIHCACRLHDSEAEVQSLQSKYTQDTNTVASSIKVHLSCSSSFIFKICAQNSHNFKLSTKDMQIQLWNMQQASTAWPEPR